MTFSYLCKIVSDRIFALLGLASTSPIFLIVSIFLIARREPIFFKQERVGKYGVPFNVYKFTTMFAGAEQGGTITIASDSRITPFGHVLRKYKINELPQLLNVLQGEMSFVGPRPLPKEETCYHDPEVKEKVLSVKPGITGLATTRFVYEDILLDKFDNPEQHYRQIILPKKGQLECFYVDNWSLALDIKIFWETIIILLSIITRNLR